MTKRSRTIAVNKIALASHRRVHTLKQLKVLPDITCYYDGETCTDPECQHNSKDCPQWYEAQLRYWQRTPSVSMRSYSCKPASINHYITKEGKKQVRHTTFPHRVIVDGKLIEVTG